MLYMFGIILIAAAGVFEETGTVIGKYEVAHKKESLYAMGFLSSVWASLFLIVIGLALDDLIFSLASLPTFLLRMVLEVILLFVSLNAVLAADRSTFSFLRTLTIPLLLVADLALGYAISTTQILGIGLMVVAFLFLF